MSVRRQNLNCEAERKSQSLRRYPVKRKLWMQGKFVGLGCHHHPPPVEEGCPNRQLSTSCPRRG